MKFSKFKFPNGNKSNGDASSTTTDAPTRIATTRPEYRRGMTRAQIRQERRERSRLRKTRRQRLYLVLASFLAIGLIIGLVLPSLPLFQPDNFGELIDEFATPDDGRTHISLGAGHEVYSTFPATSGSHYNDPDVVLADGSTISAPAPWGKYDIFLPDEVLIHNLEHGGIGLHYDCPEACPEIISTLENIPPSHYTQFIVSPYPGLIEQTGNPITVTGWRHLIRLPDVSEASVAQIRQFINTYQNRAPESRFDNQFAGGGGIHP